MNDNTGCKTFQDLLDRLGGSPPAEMEMRELEQHAADCPDCAMMLEAYLHLAGPSNEELEAQVPDTMTGTMWSRVAERTVDRGAISGSRRISLLRILAPTLAAAVVILVFALGFMLGELRHLRGVEARMTAEIERRDETIAALQVRSDDAPGLLASDRFRSLVRRRYLQNRETFRIGELMALLEQLPSDTELLSAREVGTLIGGGGLSSYSPYSERIRTVDYSNGLDAREAIMLIEALGIDADELIPRERIVSLRGI
jgi:hypothetical protein